MEKNGNRRTGLLYTLFLIALLISIALRMIFLISDRGRNEVSYLDPTLSESLVRGTIYDRNGNIIALQAPLYGFAVKKESSRAAYISSVLSPYIKISLLEAEELLRSGSGFIEMKEIPTSVDISTVNKLITALDATDEIDFMVIEERVYPSVMHSDELIGNVDEEMKGISGLEEYADSLLTPKPVLGYSIAYGSDIITTLDLDLQFALENMDEVKNNNDLTVSILSENGEVLAWHGKGSRKLYQNLILSVSNGNLSTPYFPTFPSSLIKINAVEADSDRKYLLFVDSGDSQKNEALIEGLRNILRANGRIRSQN